MGTLPGQVRFDRVRKRAGLILGPLGFAVLLLVPVPEMCVDAARRLLGDGAPPDQILEVAASARSVMAVAWLMVAFWLTEVLPLAATALLPAVLFPILGVIGVKNSVALSFDIKTTLTSYAHPVIFLFVGSFLLAGAMRKWGLDRRFAVAILSRGRVAESTRGTLFAVMLVTALASMWISNTATTAMMLPIVTRIAMRAGFEPGKSDFGTALILGVAWSATIGGLATPVGTPPNGITLSLLDAAGHSPPTFAQWMAVGVPVSLVLVGVAYVTLLWRVRPETRTIPGGRESVDSEKRALGPWSRGEIAAAAAFGLAVAGWLAASLLPSLLSSGSAGRPAGLHEAVIALGAALLLFLVPAGRHDPRHVLDARDFAYIEWPTLLLFGGGIALSEALFRTGLASVVGRGFLEVVGTTSPWLLLFALVLVITFLSEVASNTATASMMIPVVLSVAQETGADPVAMAITVGLACSFAFMLPTATAPNALAYGSGYVSIAQMIRAGIWMNLISWPIGTGSIYLFGVLIFGVLR